MKTPDEIGVARFGGAPEERDIDQLVQRLNSLHDEYQAVASLIGYGRAAVPALKRFLFAGKPGVVYQPRRAAVEVLGALGAKDVLIEYVTWEKNIADPAVRMAEEAIENAAARELARWRTRDVLETLLGFALTHSRTGVIEALGQFACPEAIPYFLHALEDDLREAAAENALRTLGRRAELALAVAARTALPSDDEERPSSVRRRTRALELLAELGASGETWPILRPLLADVDPGIATAISRIAATSGDHQDKVTAVDRLLEVLPGADWFLRGQIQDCLVSLYAEGRPRIEREIADRSELQETTQAMDLPLRTLLGVRRRAAQEVPSSSQEAAE